MATHSSILAHSSSLAWENPMDRGAWWATVHRVARSWTLPKQCNKHTRLRFN